MDIGRPMSLTNQVHYHKTNPCLKESFFYPTMPMRLEISLLQLSNSKVGFSAKGYFQINNEMITSIVGMVTTYLVVLIQFHTAAPPTQQ
ncbi:hypothetical protein J6590_014523 [Homalodisca vitripennis]|nr:hypothetical protein J6590_014523 [Homalodisca vitripennis]